MNPIRLIVEGLSRHKCLLNDLISSYSVVVRVRVVLKRTVVGDRHFKNLMESHLRIQDAPI